MEINFNRDIFYLIKCGEKVCGFYKIIPRTES